MAITGLFTRNRPQIGNLYFDALLKESTELRTEVSDFPLETAETAQDNAVTRALDITMEIGVSDNWFRDLIAQQEELTQPLFDIGGGLTAGVAASLMSGRTATLTTTSGEVLRYEPPIETRFLVDNFPQHANATAGITVFGISSRARELIQLRDDAKNNYGTVVIKAGYGDDMEGAPRWYASSLEVDVKLNYQLEPADVMNVTSRFWTLNFSLAYFSDLQNLAETQPKTGKFTILRTTHEGSLWGNTWKTTAICLWRGS